MIAPLPLAVKLHILNAYALVAVFAFSRLVHMLVVPVHYLWRPYQLVIWNWNRKRLRGQAPRPRPLPVDDTVPATDMLPEGRPALTR
jgi:nitrate reductase gamma subunit